MVRASALLNTAASALVGAFVGLYMLDEGVFDHDSANAGPAVVVIGPVASCRALARCVTDSQCDIADTQVIDSFRMHWDPERTQIIAACKTVGIDLQAEADAANAEAAEADTADSI